MRWCQHILRITDNRTQRRGKNDTKRRTFSTELHTRYSLTILCCCPQELLPLRGQLKNYVLECADSAVNCDIIFSTYVKKCLHTLNLCQ
jgi:hypothetical protein